MVKRISKMVSEITLRDWIKITKENQYQETERVIYKQQSNLKFDRTKSSRRSVELNKEGLKHNRRCLLLSTQRRHIAVFHSKINKYSIKSLQNCEISRIMSQLMRMILSSDIQFRRNSVPTLSKNCLQTNIMGPSALRLYRKVMLPSRISEAASAVYASRHNLGRASVATPTGQTYFILYPIFTANGNRKYG